MKLFYLSWKNLINQPLFLLLNILLIAFGAFLYLATHRAQATLDAQIQKNLSGIDMVVGAKGSPLQILLSSVFHLDNPTGNISYQTFEKLKNHPKVSAALPIALGDSYEGFRVVGTNTLFWEFYKFEGTFPLTDFSGQKAILGAKVAKTTGLKPGQNFTTTHGISEGLEDHEHPLEVAAIAPPTGTVVDRLIFIPLEAVYATHHLDPSDPEREITAVLVKFTDASALFSLPRIVAEQPNAVAALPSVEVSRINALMEGGSRPLHILAWGVLVLSALALFITLGQQLRANQSAYALLRMMGMSKMRLLTIVAGEVFLPIFMGLAIAFLGLLSANHFLESSEYARLFVSQRFEWKDAVILLPTLGLGVLILAVLSQKIRFARLQKYL